MKVIKNYLYNASYQLLIILVPLITTPYVNRVLEPYGVGVNTYTYTLVQYFILVGSLGVAIYGNREIAYLRDDPLQMSKAFWEIQIVKVIGISIATVCYFFFAFFYKKYTVFLILQYANLFAAVVDISWFFQGVENFKITVVRNTVVKLISVALIFGLVHSKDDLNIYISIYGISTLIGNLTLWPYIKSYLVPIRFSSLRPLDHLRSSISLFIPQAALQIYQVLNKTILGIFVGTNASGFYYNADTIEKMLLSFVTAIGTVMLPHAAHAYTKGNKEQINNLMYVSANVTTCVTAAFSFGIAAIALKFAPLFFGSKFAQVGVAMMIEAPVIYFAGISGVLGTQFMLPTGQTKDYSTSLILGAVVSIILNFIFIPLFGLYGAMISTVLAELSVMSYQILVVMIRKPQLKARSFFLDTEKYLIAGVAMFFVTFLINMTTPTSFTWLICEIVMGGIVYIAFIWLLKPAIIGLTKRVFSRKILP